MKRSSQTNRPQKNVKFGVRPSTRQRIDRIKRETRLPYVELADCFLDAWEAMPPEQRTLIIQRQLPATA